MNIKSAFSAFLRGNTSVQEMGAFSGVLITRSAWLCLFLQLFTLAAPVAAGVAAAKTGSASSSWAEELLSRPAQVYQLAPGESTTLIAERLGLTLPQLQTYNQFRTFSKPFSQLTTGDELDIPASGMKIFSRSATGNAPTGKGGESGGSQAGDEDPAAKLAGHLSGLAGMASSGDMADAAASAARSAVTSKASQSVEQWLGQFGTVQAQLSMNDDWRLEDSSIDWLLPLYETPGNLLFTQLGWRNKDERNTLNLGMGMRWFTADSMYGVNGFYDADITGGNRRLGLGLEYWRDYLTMSANGYFRLTDWHQSMDYADYDERPANGWDVRLNGWLPDYPQLGGKLVYEKYYGDDVALFGSDPDQRQKNPHAVTAGINWTPFPLLTVGLDHRAGEEGQKDTSVNLQLTWKPDASWDSQISPSEVDGMRRLSGSRHNLVDRNNDIVLEYRKQVLIKSSVGPSAIKDVPGSTHAVAVQVSSKYPLQGVHWDNAAFLAAGGTFTQTDMTRAQLTLPAHQASPQAGVSAMSQTVTPVSNFYVLTATAVDSNGNRSTPQELTVEVLPPQLNFSGELTVTGDGAPADGKTPVTITATVLDSNNAPFAGQTVNFSAPAGSVTASAVTDVSGRAMATMTSTVAGKTTVTATTASLSQAADVTFMADETTAGIATGDLTVTADNAVADGAATNGVKAVVKDANGNPVVNQPVGFGASNGATVTAVTVNTDTNGEAITTLTSTTAGASTVTATVNGGSQQVNVAFTGDSSRPDATKSALSASPVSIVADGRDASRLTLMLKDVNGNVITGQSVTFSSTLANSQTGNVADNGDGTYTAVLTGTSAGTANVTVNLNGSALAVTPVVVTLMADGSTGDITTPGAGLTTVADNAVANGSATNSVRAIVTDANGNPVSGAVVSFSAGNGATIAATGTTGADGGVTQTLTSLKAGLSTVTATVNGSSATAGTTFVADGSTGGITTPGAGLSTVADNAVANGSAINSVRAIVTDANGNPVSGVVVSFSAGNGATIAATGTTGADGGVTQTLTSLKAGLSTVTATINGSSATTSTTFVADGSTSQIGSGDLRVMADGAIADGAEVNAVMAVVRDAGGNPVENQTVAFTATNGATMAASGTTGTDGRVVMSLTSRTVGQSVVTATVNGSSQSVTLTFVTNNGSAGIAAGDLVVLSDYAAANGTDTNRVQATVKDSVGNPVAGMAVIFSAGKGATPATQSVTTDVNGVAAFGLSSLTAGAVAVTATVNGNQRAVTTTFVADGGSAHLPSGSLTVAANGALADGAQTNSVKAVVTDAKGNPVANQAVAFTATNGATMAATGTTGTDGAVTLPLTSTTAGLSTVTATVNGSSQSVQVTFITASGSAGIAAGDLMVLKDNAAANGTDTNRVQATVKDAGGNPVSGMAVLFSAGNGASPATQSVTTDASGRAQFSYSSTVAGTVTVLAAVNGSRQSTDTAFIPDAATAGVASGSLVVLSNGARADGVSTNTVRATVRDANGNPVAGQTVSFSADNGASASSTGVSNAQGYVTATVTSVTAGDSVVTATLNAGSESVTVSFVADPGTATIAAGDLTVTADNATANGTGANRVQAVVKDDQNNPVSGLGVVFTLDNGAQPNTRTVVTDGSGMAALSFTNTTAGITTVTASAGNSRSVDTTFVADTATLRVTGLAVTEDGAIANGGDTNAVRATVSDAHGNPVSGAAVGFTTTNGATVSPTGTTGADGTVTVTLTSSTSGVSTVTADANGSRQSADVNFVSDQSTADIRNGALTLPVDGSVADGTAVNRASALVTDANGNSVSGVDVVFTLSNGVLPNTQTVRTDASGVAELDFTSTHAGPVTVMATVRGNVHTVAGSFIADGGTAGIGNPGAGLTTETDDAIANGTATNSVEATVTDANGNPVSGAVVNFSADNGATIAATGTTGADGTVTQTLTSLTAGISTVTATHNGSSATTITEFVADSGNLNPSRSALGAVPSTIVADNAATSAVTLTLKDANGNPVSGQTVTFSSTLANSVFGVVTDNRDGSYTAALRGTTAGAANVTANVNGSALAVTPVVVTLTAGAASAVNGALSAAPATIVANNTEESTLTLVLKDANNNPVTGKTVSYSSSVANVTFSSNAESSTAGTYTVKMKGTTAGTTTVSATVGGITETTVVTLKAGGASATNSSLSANPTSIEANNTEQSTLTLVLKDTYNNPVTGKTVSYKSSLGNVTFSNNVESGTAGTYTVKMKGSSRGGATITAVVDGVNIKTTSVTLWAYVDMPGDLVTKQNPYTFAINAGFPKTGIAGAIFQLRVNNNAANNASYNWSVQQGNASVNSSGEVTVQGKGQVSIIAASKTDLSLRYRYQYSIILWGTRSTGGGNYTTARNGCAANGRRLPTIAEYTSGSRGVVGSLASEWGNLLVYGYRSGGDNWHWTSTLASGHNDNYVLFDVRGQAWSGSNQQDDGNQAWWSCVE